MDKFSFRRYRFVVLSAALVPIFMLMSGCCTQRRVVEQNTAIIQQKDSADIEVKVEKVIEYHTDTVFIEIPTQIAERTTADSTSHLENDYALSDARINIDGTLYHDLRTKPQKKAAEVNIPTIRNDSIRTEYKTKIEYITLTEKKEVEKELTWWQHTCIKWFPWSLALLIIAIGFDFRKPIIKLIRQILKIKSV